MGRRESATWGRRGRRVAVVLLTGLAAKHAVSSVDGAFLTPGVAAVLLCGLVLFTSRGHWLIAPVLTTVSAGIWGWPLLPLLLVVLFELAAQRRAAAALGFAATAAGANTLVGPDVSLWAPQQYGSCVLLTMAVVGGLWMGNRRRLVEALNTRVEHLRTERRLREEAARSAERSAIAAEMHDVLAHRLSLIALHTGVLITRKDALPDPVVERLTLLRTASTEALADLRDVLGALREPGAVSDDAAPVPVLRDVHELVAQARAAGQPVSITVTGAPERAPAAHRLAVYRVVQEALTNARKHAPGSPVRVRIDHGPPATLVEVVNEPGVGAADAVPSGFGLVGLRERVAALGGHLHAGASGAGAWRVAAHIPHPPTPAPTPAPTPTPAPAVEQSCHSDKSCSGERYRVAWWSGARA
ncbi:sensor histidine kinase [Streptomyces radicis]|uniref:sensor histidine kinase n=1 Tax=Streptomyces radicis TaxID=1750517 RepID=UPI0026984C32